jgi:hypothetical protein
VLLHQEMFVFFFIEKQALCFEMIIIKMKLLANKKWNYNGSSLEMIFWLFNPQLKVDFTYWVLMLID